MKIETHITDRKRLANEIGEHIGASVRYDGPPSFGYSIGPVTIDRNSNIMCDERDVWAMLQPYFEANGWTEQMEEQQQEHPDITLDSEPAAHNDLLPKPETEHTVLSIPVESLTLTGMSNILRTLYARQDLINAMFRADILRIDEELVTLLKDTVPQSTEDISELLTKEVGIGMVSGVYVLDGRLRIVLPDAALENGAYAEFLQKVVDAAANAHHVSAVRVSPAEDEMKYNGNSWLNRLGFGGPDHKALRHTLLGHMSGYAAFKDSTRMLTHKERLAEKRRQAKEADHTEGGEDA